MRSRSGPAGFSLIELLVVVVIVVVLAAILLPAVATVRASALQVACAGQQRQLGVALLVYAQGWAGILPPRYVANHDLPAEWLADPLYSSGWPAFWTHPRFIGSCMEDGYNLVAGAVPSGARSVFRCPADSRTQATTVDLGMSAAVSPDIWSPWGSWKGRIPLSRYQDIDRVPVLADTSEPRWEAYPGNLVSGPADASIGWSADQLSPFFLVRRHRDGVNMLYADGHVALTLRPTAEAGAGIIKVDPR